MAVTIKEISSKKEFSAFVEFPNKLFAKSPFYVPPIHTDELNTLLVDKNPAFEFCKAKYWLAIKNNQIVGRIAGIINYKYNKERNTNYARFGWLDFEKDEEVLQCLLNTTEEWAIKENMDYIHGPLGFTSFDASGILVEGFDELPTSFGRYNLPYYPELIEKIGYKKDVDWIEFRVKMPDKVPDKIIKGSRAIQKRYNLRRLEIKKTKELLKYSEELFEILNESYKGIYAFSTLSKKQIENLKKHFIPFLSPDYISIIVDKEDNVIGFGISIPSLSKALMKSKGKLFPFGYFRIWQALRKNDTVDLLLIGVKPEYQNKGVHAIIFEKIGQTFFNNKIKYLETTRELENNSAVKQLWSNFELRQHKRSRCYIKKI